MNFEILCYTILGNFGCFALIWAYGWLKPESFKQFLIGNALILSNAVLWMIVPPWFQEVGYECYNMIRVIL